jgi:copper chaperone NosL
MKNLIRSGLLLTCVALLGCAGDGPPTVRYGEEECAHCRMIVNDDRFAAALVTPAGEARKFDDVVCLVDQLRADPNAAKGLWVRGYRSGQWHDARQAFYVRGPKLQTPMGSGLAAVPTRDEADVLAAELGGRVLRFDELADFLKKANEQKKADAQDGAGDGPHGCCCPSR